MPGMSNAKLRLPRVPLVLFEGRFRPPIYTWINELDFDRENREILVFCGYNHTIEYSNFLTINGFLYMWAACLSNPVGSNRDRSNRAAELDALSPERRLR